ncbi:MAG: hypothetical protein JO025_09080 [Verrucomicrobia bacterium]|nr:hypothetical protein [Verrucomicrobiota bacterium]
MEVQAELVCRRHRGQKINPDFERFMAKRAGSVIVEVKGSHAVYVSQPKAIADLIKNAAAGKNTK